MRMTPLHLFFGIVKVACTLFAPAAPGQPFFQPSGNSFTPEISVVSSGVLRNAQATVSADRKYVTLTMRPQNWALVALRDFTFQNGVNGRAFGFVGFPPPPAPPAKNAAQSRNARSRAGPRLRRGRREPGRAGAGGDDAGRRAGR